MRQRETLRNAASQLENVVASALLAIKYEVLVRKWDRQRPEHSSSSPIIRLHGAKSDGYISLYAACEAEMLPNTGFLSAALRPMSDNHIHIQNDPPMLGAFEALGAKHRLFGNRPMIPGINNLRVR